MFVTDSEHLEKSYNWTEDQDIPFDRAQDQSMSLRDMSLNKSKPKKISTCSACKSSFVGRSSSQRRCVACLFPEE